MRVVIRKPTLDTFPSHTENTKDIVKDENLKKNNSYSYSLWFFAHVLPE